MELSEILVRPMAVGEGKATAELYRQVLMGSPYYNSSARAELLKVNNASNLELKARGNANSVIIAISNGEIVGFCFSEDDSNTIWLDWIGIKESHRNRKIAFHLLQHLESTANYRNAFSIWCDTHCQNTSAINFFIQQGFKQIGLAENHWWGLDLIFWKKDIRRPPG